MRAVAIKQEHAELITAHEKEDERQRGFLKHRVPERQTGRGIRQAIMSHPYHHITCRQDQGVLVLEVTESKLTDYDVSRALEAEMVEAVAAADGPGVVVNLENVRMVTSVALLPFLGLRRRVRELGERAVLCNVSEPVAQVLSVAQLIVERRSHSSHLVMAADVDAAIALVTRPAESED